MLFTKKLLARCGEKRIATYTTHVHDVNHTTYSNFAVMYHRGQSAEIFLTAPEVDSPPYIFSKFTVYQLVNECWNIIIILIEVCLMSQSWDNVAGIHDHLLTGHAHKT